MRIGSLFSGAGGLDMAVEQVFGGQVIWQSEVDKAASKVLAYRFPGVPNLGDITTIDWSWHQPVDILCGGFPCTDVSAAGKRAGMHGTRSGLWSEFAKAIDILRPRMVVIENVRGLLSAHANRPMESDVVSVGDGGTVAVLRAAGAVLGDLADLGYDAVWATVAAADVGAPHRRERVFIVANLADSSRYGWDEGRPESVGIVGGFDAAVSGDEPGRIGWIGHRDRYGVPYASNADTEPEPGVALLPTPRNTDGERGPSAESGGTRPSGQVRQKDLNTVTARELGVECCPLLSTPTAQPGGSRSGKRIGEPLLRHQAREMESAWGKYEPAIRRWEQIVGPAPAPTEPNKNGNPRLSAAFSQWLMGWPDGWVTDPAIRISRNDQLRILGNGVVVQQAIAALRYLLAVAS